MGIKDLLEKTYSLFLTTNVLEKGVNMNTRIQTIKAKLAELSMLIQE